MLDVKVYASFQSLMFIAMNHDGIDLKCIIVHFLTTHQLVRISNINDETSNLHQIKPYITQ